MSDRRTLEIDLSPSGAQTGNGSNQPVNLSAFTEALLFVHVTAITGTLDLDFKVGPESDDVNYIHTEPAQISAPGYYLTKLTNIGPWGALAWAPSSSATFTAKLVGKN